MSKYTKPPWFYDEEDGSIRSENRGKQLDQIGTVGYYGCINAKVDHANGKMMAASPELYRALRSLVLETIEWEKSVEQVTGIHRVYPWGTLEDAKAALEKAEGR